MQRFDEIQTLDIQGAVSMHAMHAGPDQWLYTKPGYSNMIRATRQQLITALADDIGCHAVASQALPVTRIIATEAAGHVTDLRIDGCRNTWHDGEYMPAEIYLQMIVPNDADDAMPATHPYPRFSVYPGGAAGPPVAALPGWPGNGPRAAPDGNGGGAHAAPRPADWAAHLAASLGQSPDDLAAKAAADDKENGTS